MRISVSEEYCIGCGLCEIYCAVEHSGSKGVIEAFRRGGPVAYSRVRLEERGPVSFPVQCHNCSEPDCVYSCPTGAMAKSSDGVVTYSPNRCIGCWICVMVCRYGALRRVGASPSTVLKCDFCAGRKLPACVENCPNGALEYVED